MDFTFELAPPDDDAALRRLVRENPVPGRVTVTYEREPSYFDGCATLGPSCQVLVARHTPTGALAGVACRSVSGSSDLSFTDGSDEALPAIAAFLQEHGAAKQFFPVYSPDDFGPEGTTPGFSPCDFVVARQDDQIAGVMGLWDLSACKKTVILLFDAAGQIQGFSTLMRLEVCADGQPVVGFFSGDTIIDRAHWGTTALPRRWARHVFQKADAIDSSPVYWFLISGGYKTYRFLPVFFRTFYPTHEHATPPLQQRILEALARKKFPDAYDANRGVVRPRHATPLRDGVAEPTERHLQNPHVAFFLRKNPGYTDGDELACLTEIAPANLTRAGRRMLGR